LWLFYSHISLATAIRKKSVDKQKRKVMLEGVRDDVPHIAVIYRYYRYMKTAMHVYVKHIENEIYDELFEDDRNANYDTRKNTFASILHIYTELFIIKSKKHLEYVGILLTTDSMSRHFENIDLTYGFGADFEMLISLIDKMWSV